MKRFDKWKEIIVIAAPVVVSKLSFTTMGLVDTAMVGRLGPSEQAAVGIATTFMFTLYIFGLGIVGVVNTYVAQYHGAGNPRECGVVLGHGMRLAALLGGITWVVLVLSEPLFSMVGLSEEVSGSGYEYLFYRSIGLPGVFFYWAYNGYMEGLGRTRSPMWISLAANGINIVLDYVFIFGAGPIPEMGVKGAGIATAGSNLFMLICFAVLVHRPRGEFSRFGTRDIWSPIRRSLLVKMWKTGLPMGIQFFLEIGAFLAFSIMVGWVSDEALAANQVALRLMSISFMTAWGISTAATTLVGRHQGEGRSDLAYEAGVRAVFIALMCSTVCAALFVTIPGRLVELFTASNEVVGIAQTLLYVVAILQIFDGLRVVSYGALKGAGDTRWPMYMTISLEWGLGTPLVYIFTIGAGLGVLGAWLGMLLMLVVESLLMLLRFRRGRWRELRMVRV